MIRHKAVGYRGDFQFSEVFFFALLACRGMYAGATSGVVLLLGGDDPM